MAIYCNNIGDIVEINGKDIQIVAGTMNELGYTPWQYIYNLVLTNPFINQNLQIILQYILYIVIILQMLYTAYKMLVKHVGSIDSMWLIVQMQLSVQLVMCLKNGNPGIILPQMMLVQTLKFINSDNNETNITIQIILMAIACIKPQLGGLICLVYFIYYPVKTQVTCQIFIGVPWLLQQVVLNENPLSLLSGQFNNGTVNYNNNIVCGILNPIVRVGIIQRTWAVIIQVAVVTMVVVFWTLYCKSKIKRAQNDSVRCGYRCLNLQLVLITQLFWMYVNKCDYTIAFIAVILMAIAYKSFGFEISFRSSVLAMVINILTLNRCDFVEFYDQQIANLAIMVYSDTFIMICWLLWWIQQYLNLRRLLNGKTIKQGLNNGIMAAQALQLMLQILGINLV